MLNKKILMILTREPYPIDNGRKSIIAQTIDFLKDKYEISLMIFSKDELNIELYKSYNFSSVKKLFFPSKLELFKNMILYKNKSLQERLFYSRKSQILINNEIDIFKPDIIYADMIRTAQYIENILDENIQKIVDIDDLLSIRYSRFLKNKENSILGTFQNLLPTFLRKILENLLKNIILKKEIKLISKREIEIARSFDQSFLVSAKEVEYLSKITNTKNIHTNTQAIKQRKNIYISSNANNFVFIGNMSTPQNISSLEMIVNEILPSFDFEYKLFIIGKYDNRTIKLTKNNINIELLGFVKDLEDVLSNMKLALMPISFGTGIKTKILDCMSYGIPVITNKIGNEGLSTIDKKNILICNESMEYKEILNNILKDENLLKQIGLNAQIYVRENHNFYKLKTNFLKIIEGEKLK
jgi:glycosyltransferase involved in cell wall biosynthesis